MAACTSGELAGPGWDPGPPDPVELGPFGRFPRLDDARKESIWQAYREGCPVRPPVALVMNNRVFVLDERFNSEGLSYQAVFTDAKAMMVAQLRAQLIVRRRYNVMCDLPTDLPECWQVTPHFQNVYEAAGLGAPIIYPPGDVPCTIPIEDRVQIHRALERVLDRPLQQGVFRIGIEMTERMRKLADGATFLGRPIRVDPYAELGTDGPLTVAMNVCGHSILTDLIDDPHGARELLAKIVAAALTRRRALLELWDLPEPEEVWMADDSIAMLSVAQYREQILPHHREWYDRLDPDRTRRRGMHLCGDATRHFDLIASELGVSAFDTGYPVDFAALRETLGPEVEIAGGVEVPRLLSDAPAEVHARAREILSSGVLTGGWFILRDANNLPPGVPWGNLAAMYHAVFEKGSG